MPLKKRVQVDNPLLGASPVLTPRARPVDTFVAPSNNPPLRDNRLDDLGRALQGINESFVNTAVRGAERQDEKDFAKAVNDHRKQTQNINSAVDAGMIPFAASPAYLRGLVSAQLGSLGYKFRSGLLEAFQGSEALRSDDPAAVQSFIKEYQSTFAKENLGSYDDLDIANYYESAEIGAIKELQANHTNSRLAAAARAGENVLTQKAADVLAAYHSVPDSKKDLASLTDALARIVDPTIEGNLTYLRFPKKRANKAIVIAVVESAIAFDDITMLDALRNVPTGNGGRLGEIAEYKKMLRQAEDEIVGNEIQGLRDRKLRDELRVVKVTIEGVGGVLKLLKEKKFNEARAFVHSSDMMKYAPKQARTTLNDITNQENNNRITRVTSTFQAAQIAAARAPGITLAEVQRIAATLPLSAQANLFRHYETMKNKRPFFDEAVYGEIEKEMQAIFLASGERGARAALAARRDLPEAKTQLEGETIQWIIDHDDKTPNRAELREIMQAIADSRRFGLLAEGAANQDYVESVQDDAAFTDLSQVPGHQRIVEDLIVQLGNLDEKDSFARRFAMAEQLAVALEEGKAARREFLATGTQEAIQKQDQSRLDREYERLKKAKALEQVIHDPVS